MGRFKNQYLPRELQDLAVFFNARMLNDWYPMIGVHEYDQSLPLSDMKSERYEER